MENLHSQPEISREGEGRWLKSKLGELLINGDYDFPKFEELDIYEDIDPDDPYLKSIRADYIRDDDVYVYIAGAATPEISGKVGIASRNSIELRWPEDFDDDGDAITLASLTVYIDENSNRIGCVERDIRPAPKYRAVAKGPTKDIESPEFIQKMTEVVDMEFKINSEPLIRKEFEFIKKVLSSLDRNHQVESSHLRFFGRS